MADEQATPIEPEVVVTPPAEPAAPPHPLQEGGVRFEEVYREAKEAKRENETLRERLARLEGQLSATPKPQVQQPQFYTPEQLQAAVDAGKITPAASAAQLAWQAKELGKQELRAEITAENRSQSAKAEVNDYIARIPALNSTSSAEFAKVSRVANEIADEMGVGVLDPRVQRRALREAFGPLDKLARVETTREFSRTNADTHTEVGGGGGATSSSADPLKGVEPERLEHWKRLGYTPAQMAEEAKFIKRPLRRVLSR